MIYKAIYASFQKAGLLSLSPKRNISKTMDNTEYKIIWVGLLIVKERKLLMTREKGKDLFQLPGGAQDDNENCEETLRREIKEELGVEIKKPQLYDDFILPGRHEKVNIRFLIYTAEILGEVKAGVEIEEIRMIGSDYEKDSIDIGNPTKLVLIPKLRKENIID